MVKLGLRILDLGLGLGLDNKIVNNYRILPPLNQLPFLYPFNLSHKDKILYRHLISF